MVVLQSLVVGVLICLAAAYARFLWKRRRLYELAGKLAGPSGLPFIGLAYRLVNKSCIEIFELVTTITKGYASPAKLWIGPQLIIFADTPEALQVVLNSQACIEKTPFYDLLICKKGLLISKGELWKHHRKVLTPAFRLSALQELVPTFDQKSRILVKNLNAEVGKSEFDVYKYVTACSLETLLKGLMESDQDIQTDPLNNKYLHLIEM